MKDSQPLLYTDDIHRMHVFAVPFARRTTAIRHLPCAWGQGASKCIRFEQSAAALWTDLGLYLLHRAFSPHTMNDCLMNKAADDCCRPFELYCMDPWMFLLSLSLNRGDLIILRPGSEIWGHEHAFHSACQGNWLTSFSALKDWVQLLKPHFALNLQL